jgi:hypothetical protein
MSEIQPVPFLGWVVISAAMFFVVAFAYRAYQKKKKT